MDLNHLHYSDDNELKLIAAILLKGSFIFLIILNIVIRKYTKQITDLIQSRVRFHERALLV